MFGNEIIIKCKWKILFVRIIFNESDSLIDNIFNVFVGLLISATNESDASPGLGKVWTHAHDRH